MSLRSSWFVLGLAVSLFACAEKKKCDASSCALGCCSAAGQCVAPSGAQCGALGGACVTCAPTQLCQLGVCSMSGAGAGGGGGNAGTGGGGGAGPGLGGNGGGPGSGSGLLTSYRAVFDAYCGFLERCGALGQGEHADCVAAYSSLLTASVASPTELDHVSFTAEGTATLQACRAALDALTCAGSFTDACPGLGSSFPDTVGNVPTGGACIVSSLECASDADSCVGLTCPRQCRTVPTGSLGATCLRSGGCNAGLFCDSSNVCQALKAPGASCASSRECQSECSGGVCLTPIAPGAACTQDGTACVQSHYCEGSCVPRKPLGATCRGARWPA